MKEHGVIIKLQNNIATVRVDRHSACGNCHACSLGMEDKQYVELEVNNTVHANINDIVELDMESTNVLLAAFIVYGFPLISMLFGFCISYYVIFKNNTLISVISSFIFVTLAFVSIKLNEEKIKKSEKFLPKIIRIVS